jgi:hypothetical protein
VEAFRKEIIFGRNNPMCVRHISYRVEFQGNQSNWYKCLNISPL